MALELIIVLFSPIRAFGDTHGIVIGIEGVGSHLVRDTSGSPHQEDSCTHRHTWNST